MESLFVYADQDKSMDKKFKTYKEQLRLLKSKGLIIADEEHAIEVLRNVSYFALINGYKRPFKDTNGNYLTNTTFEDIEQLYLFDEQLRIFMLKQLLSIERRVKSSISYHFSNQFREVNAYFNVNNFDYTGLKVEEINKLVSILKSIHDDNKRSYIKHYKEHHNEEIPLWVLINAMTFGLISKMYSLFKESTQQRICNDFYIPSQRDMEQILNMITLFRNVCAHNERLYDYHTRSGISEDYIRRYIICAETDTFERERKRFFGALVCCKCLMPGLEGARFFEELEKFIYNADVMKNQKLKNILLSEMGMPDNWTGIQALG